MGYGAEDQWESMLCTDRLYNTCQMSWNGICHSELIKQSSNAIKSHSNVVASSVRPSQMSRGCHCTKLPFNTIDFRLFQFQYWIQFNNTFLAEKQIQSGRAPKFHYHQTLYKPWSHYQEIKLRFSAMPQLTMVASPGEFLSFTLCEQAKLPFPLITQHDASKHKLNRLADKRELAASVLLKACWVGQLRGLMHFKESMC